MHTSHFKPFVLSLSKHEWLDFAMCAQMMMRLGGMAGDTLGAAVELTEVAVLVALALSL